MNLKSSPRLIRINLVLASGWLILTLLAYFPLLFHPELHLACPENDTWNLPVRWSVLSSLREGQLPLWNPLSGFGMPWLASWATETFYPGTLLFVWKGLSAWNISGILHLLVFSVGIFTFLRASKVGVFWAFFSASIGLLNACAYNHLGSNAPMDTMAWMPWMFWATKEVMDGKPWGNTKWALLLALQILAGYPQILIYTLAGCGAYALYFGGMASALKLVMPFCLGLLLTTAQWLPSVEFFLLHSVRMPAVPNNPHFFLPLENLKTFIDWNALANPSTPDYVASPTYFFFNLYSGPAPVATLLLGLLKFKRLGQNSLFFLTAFVLTLLWATGFFVGTSIPSIFPIPTFLEPAKSCVLINVFVIFMVGFIWEDLSPKQGKMSQWIGFICSLVFLVVPIWLYPYETNLTPPHSNLETETRKIKDHLGSGRVLVLPNEKEHRALYQPDPHGMGTPLFKHFIPNNNLFSFLPLANIYSSTWSTWGSWDANAYFKYGFPYAKGRLMDLLGVDLLLLTSDQMPPPFEKVWSEEAWTLWKNPGTMGGSFTFTGKTNYAERKNIFTLLAKGEMDPRKTLFVDPVPISLPPEASQPPLSAQFFEGGGDYRVITQNAMPGWRSWVDGKPQAIYQADGIFLCVPLSNGARRVSLSYEPTSFRLGLFISLLALVGFAGAGFYRTPSNGTRAIPWGSNPKSV